MKKFFISLLTFMLILSFGGCGKKSKEDFLKENASILKNISRKGILDDLYKQASQKYKKRYNNSRFGNFGEYINTVTRGLKSNGYPVDEFFEIMTDNEEALIEFEKEGMSKEVGRAFLAYTAIVYPMTLIGHPYYSPMTPNEFIMLWNSFDKRGLTDKDSKQFYEDTIHSDYGKYFDIGL